jgi:predicted lipase
MSAAYYDEANIQRVVPAKSSYAYVDKSFFSGSTGVNRFLASKSSEARVVVAFRGTDYKSEKDVLADINILMPPWPYGGGGTVHAGFLGQYTEQRSDLLSRMQAQFGAGNRNWLVTGHSLGGALATIAARDLKAQFPSATVDLIVFGN